MAARLLVASALALAVATPGAHSVARDVSPATARQAFKTSAELVTVPVTVTRRSGDVHIGGLTAQDLRLFEDGVEQRITFVDRERRPVSLLIVLDSSNSMEGPKRALAAAVTQATLAALLPDDEAALMVFAAEMRVPIPWTAAGRFPKIDWAGWKLTGGTALNDALKQALAIIDQARNPRPVIVFVSDGEEASSTITLEQVVATRRQSETLVYGFRVDGMVQSQQGDAGFPGGNAAQPPSIPGTTLGGANTPIRPLSLTNTHLNALVGDSGGKVFTLSRVRDAAATARALVDELRYLYTIGYVPAKSLDGKYRRITIEPRDRTHRVRHRGGYLAAPPK